MKSRWAGLAGSNEKHPKDQSHRVRRWFLFNAIFITSFSLLAFEITLSRLLSVLFSYHYVFLVLSLALLGLGVGGILVHFLRPRFSGGSPSFRLLPFYVSLFSMAISFSVILSIQTGFIQNLRDNLPFHWFLFFIPFLFAGMFLAELYHSFPAISSRIYGVDLVGAAAGSLGVIYILNALDGIGTVFLLGAAVSIASILLDLGKARKIGGLGIISIFSFLILWILSGINLMGIYKPEVPIGKNPDKEIHDVLHGPHIKGKILETRWSAFGRTDLIQLPGYPDQMDIYLDGTAGSPMYRFSGDSKNPGPTISKLKETFPGYFPFLYIPEEEKNHALIIGPGGGRDILLALMGGMKQITAVEVNEDLVNIVKKYSGFNGGIYRDCKQVKIVVEEGRIFLKRQKEKYDLIMLSLPVTNTSRSLEGYALTENFIFTTDSIGDYLDHLKDKGRLVVVGHDDVEILRLLSISLSALGQKGISYMQAMSQIYIVGSDDYLVFVLKKEPLKQQEVSILYLAMQQLAYDAQTSYFPYVHAPLNPALTSLGRGAKTLQGLIQMVEERGYDISPVTDDNPFFYKFERGIPKIVSGVFWSAAAILILIALVPAIQWKNKGTPPQVLGKKIEPQKPTRIFRFLLLFSLLGIGFMMIEIWLIQRFVLFLGQPVLSLAIQIFSLLLGAGLGSLWSGRITPARVNRWIIFSSLFTGATVLIYNFLLPFIFNQFLGLDLGFRLGITLLLSMQLGFFMGMPFPLGIRLLKNYGMESRIPWMWGINGAGSVVGSAMTIVVAMSSGFTAALLISASCYFFISLIFLWKGRSKREAGAVEDCDT